MGEAAGVRTQREREKYNRFLHWRISGQSLSCSCVLFRSALWMLDPSRWRRKGDIEGIEALVTKAVGVANQ